MSRSANGRFWTAKTGLLTILLAPLLAVSPFLAGALLSLAFCGPDANEGSCGWAALPWFMFLTIPLGALMLIAGVVIVIVSLVKKVR